MIRWELSVYLVCINVFALAFFGLTTWIASRRDEVSSNAVAAFLSLAGGSAGVLLGIVVFDRRLRKENAMARVLILCTVLLQILAFFFFRRGGRSGWNFAFWDFLAEHRLLAVYLAAVNLLALILYGTDKWRAVHGRSRIRILTLLGVAFLGGVPGGLLAMYGFRHKIRKPYFVWGLPLMLLTHLALLFFCMNW